MSRRWLAFRHNQVIPVFSLSMYAQTEMHGRKLRLLSVITSAGGERYPGFPRVTSGLGAVQFTVETASPG